MLKNLVVIGCASALGRALVERWAERSDVRLFLTSRSTISGERQSTSSEYLPGIDLTSATNLDTLGDAVDEYFQDGFDVVCTVGHYDGQRPDSETTLDHARSIFDSNLMAVYGATRVMIPLMIKRGGGHFLAFSCNSVRYQYPLMAPFTAAKAGVESLMASLAHEHSGSGIVCNSLVMATMKTEREVLLKPHGDHEKWLKPAEVASVVEWLLNESTGLVNGNSIAIYKHSESFYHESYFDRVRRD